MKPSIRKIGEPIPVALLIQPDGALVLADGSDVKTYLAGVYQNAEKLGDVFDGDPLEISIADRKVLAEFELAYVLCRSLGA